MFKMLITTIFHYDTRRVSDRMAKTIKNYVCVSHLLENQRGTKIMYGLDFLQKKIKQKRERRIS